ncbi:hypothetical protein OAP32_00495 [Crocinitomicaceae bacterium]|nr:hypothetical protein [Crocinitomicaceae bacterium]
MLPLVPIVSALASFAPSIAGWFGGDKAEEAASRVANIALKVTGLEDPKKATDLILTDPSMQLEFMKLVELQRNELDKLYLADRQNARQMYRATQGKQADMIANHIMKFNIIYAVLVALAQIIAIAGFDLPSAAVVVIGNVSGWLIKGMLDERAIVCGFYYGSSMDTES